MAAEALSVNAQIISERFDDEVVLIDVQKGLYFSLLGSAVDLWAQFQAPRRVDDVVSAFTSHYGGVDGEDLRGAIESFVEHELLLEVPADTAASPTTALSLSAFSAPKVEVYGDLAELIAFDPVHEVDQAAGWPVRPPDFTTA